MHIKKIMELLKAENLTGEELKDLEVEAAFSCDLMSDVLSFVDNKVILLTGLTNLQVIRTAEMLDLNAIVFVRGKVPDKEVIDLAKDMGIVLLSTKYTMYSSSGILYQNGLKGI